jgi:hypothetical protein
LRDKSEIERKKERKRTKEGRIRKTETNINDNINEEEVCRDEVD